MDFHKNLQLDARDDRECASLYTCVYLFYPPAGLSCLSAEAARPLRVERSEPEPRPVTSGRVAAKPRVFGKARPPMPPVPKKVKKPLPKLKKIKIDGVLVGEIAPVLKAALWNDTGHIKGSLCQVVGKVPWRSRQAWRTGGGEKRGK